VAYGYALANPVGTGTNYTYLDAGERPASVQANVYAHTSTGLSAGLVYRGVDSDNFWLALLYYNGNSEWRLYNYLCTDGTYSREQMKTVTCTANAFYCLRIEDDGTNINV